MKNIRHAIKRKIVLRVFAVVVSLSLSNCTTLIKSKDHSRENFDNSHYNAFLWRRVKDEPAIFYPKELPRGYPVNPKTGDWVIDPQDQTAFFVPNRDCGGLSPAIWRAEAIKGVNKYSKSEQSGYNAVTILIGWPTYAAGYIISNIPPPGL